MSIYNGSADDEFKRYLAAVKDVARAHSAASSADAELAEALRAYAKARPLTEEERAVLAAHVLGGGALCCAKGAEFMAGILPAPWVDAINEWAHDRLSCAPRRDEADEKERRVREEARVGRLKLDCIPCEEEG